MHTDGEGVERTDWSHCFALPRFYLMRALKRASGVVDSHVREDFRPVSPVFNDSFSGNDRNRALEPISYILM